MQKLIEQKNIQIGVSSTLRTLPKSFKLDEIIEDCAGTCISFLMTKKLDGLGLSNDGAKHFSLSVTLCGDDKMKGLNSNYRNKLKTTDVLSFPIFENLRAKDEFIFAECELGDIVISWPVLRKQASEFEVSQEEEFIHLFVHGFLHLCGYDHELSAAEEELMQVLEKKLIINILKKRKLRI